MGYEPQSWGTAAQWVSAIGTTIGLGFTAVALFKRHRDDRILAFDRGYRDHRAQLQTFWKSRGANGLGMLPGALSCLLR